MYTEISALTGVVLITLSKMNILTVQTEMIPYMYYGFCTILLAGGWFKFRSRKHTTSTKARTASKSSEENSVVVVGAGVAGAAMSYALAQQGRKVTCIERDLREPDRIVGELLQPGGVRRLHDLGLESILEGIDAPTVKGYAVYLNGDSVKCPYPSDGNLISTGRSFHHGRFITNLRKAAFACPNVTVKQGVVTKMIEENGRVLGVAFKDEKGEIQEARAALTICCDGAGSGLRRSLTPTKPEANSHFVALILNNCDLPYPNSGHVILADPAPILFYPISSTEVRCLIDTPGPLPSVATGAMADYLTTKIAPQLPPEIKPSFLEAVSCGRIRSMPNWELAPQKVFQRGAMLLGDSFNCRHPLTGGGMTVALSDVALISKLLADVDDLTDAAQMHAVSTRFYAERVPYASTINILASALYAVFSAKKDPSLIPMRKACFEYFKLGGRAVSGPMFLLSGMNPNPSTCSSTSSLSPFTASTTSPSPSQPLKGFCSATASSVQPPPSLFPFLAANASSPSSPLTPPPAAEPAPSPPATRPLNHLHSPAVTHVQFAVAARLTRQRGASDRHDVRQWDGVCFTLDTAAHRSSPKMRATVHTASRGMQNAV
eukprot:CAMPEP_0196662552 /NCGR_PEP_ID=MMETSP1086-20130531/49209_1 /TAXON_ID=77921 /ORGANISM="Cyanoptyche  gloeocystis , Strain SAG4.97" /LENGTH=603 /DNA_ID=CAMNT_0041997997 /DNA_START=41 /DNA_END=1853 /DNA_ORIENTATION=+